jgi:hypothetical protein
MHTDALNPQQELVFQRIERGDLRAGHGVGVGFAWRAGSANQMRVDRPGARQPIAELYELGLGGGSCGVDRGWRQERQSGAGAK